MGAAEGRPAGPSRTAEDGRGPGLAGGRGAGPAFQSWGAEVAGTVLELSPNWSHEMRSFTALLVALAGVAQPATPSPRRGARRTMA